MESEAVSESVPATPEMPKERHVKRSKFLKKESSVETVAISPQNLLVAPTMSDVKRMTLVPDRSINEKQSKSLSPAALPALV